ncbi:hypothetical protein K505DRAFT_285044, partial [Melanomma pulvis-pyrius CBS 109.77]
MQDCTVCGESLLRKEFPLLADCSHEPGICPECYAEWIATKIVDGSWREVKCPANECKVILKHHEIHRLAKAESFEQYDVLLTRNALGGDANFRWCRAPGCQSGQVHESGHAGNIFRCIACGFRVCVMHDTTWHEGETCQEYDDRVGGAKERGEQKRREEQEKASLEAIKKISKKCPGEGCGWNIQKDSGCDHMTCVQCGHEFCWVCFAPYESILLYGNDKHAKGCMYHSSRV